jgi:hypothetical protein
MSAKIHVKPEDVWKFYNRNAEQLAEEMVSIAENEDTGMNVYLTEDSDTPQLVVTDNNDKVVHEEYLVSSRDAEHSAKKIYEKYIVPIDTTTVSDDEDDEEITRSDMEDAIYEREDEILMAFEDFLEVLMEENRDTIYDGYHDKQFDDLLNKVVRTIAVDSGVRVRRPMFLIDERTGLEVYTEYPYEEYDFDDEEIVVTNGEFEEV